MSNRERDVVLNFKMNGQVQYADTLKQINMVMNNAAKEYKNHIAAMGRDASATEKLRAEKQKLEIQMDGAQKRTRMLRAEYEAMAKDTNTSAEQLNKMYGKLLDAERAETSLKNALTRVNGELSEQAQETRDAQDALDKLGDEAELLEAEQKKLISSFKLQSAELGENASEAEKNELAHWQLAQQMRLGEKAVQNLEQQLTETKKVYGENSKEVMQMEARLNDARTTIARFNRSIESIEDSSRDAEKSIEGLKGGLAGLAGAVPGAAIGGFVSSMEEVNQQLAMLEIQAMNANLAMSDFEGARNAFSSVGQDVGQITEAMGNIVQAGYKTEKEINKIAKNISGAIVKYGETFTAEGLAESITTTTQLGEVTGQLTDLLEKEGVNVEKFNEKLQGMGSEAERANYVSKILSDQGLNSMYQKYLEMNPEITKNAKEQQEMQDALSDLSVILTPLVTKVTEFITKIIEWANENPKLTLGIGVAAAALGGLVTAVSILAPIIGALIPLIAGTGTTLGAILSPILLVVGGIGLLVAAFITAYKNSETFRDIVHKTFNAIKEIITEVMEIVVTYLQEKLETIKQFWAENGDQILQAVKNVFNGIKAVIEFVMPFVKELIKSTWEAIKNVFDGALNIILGLVKTFSGLFTGDFKKMWEGIKQLFSGAVEAIWGILQLGFLGKIFKIIKSFGSKAVDVIKDMAGKFKSKFSEIVSTAKSKFNEVKAKILSPIESAKKSVSKIVDEIKGFFTKLKLKIPKPEMPKMPKFSLKTSTKSVFGKDITYPSGIDVKWNAKGAIFTRPTIFGMNNGVLQGAGEAGPEAALPLNEETLGEIGKGIAATMKPGPTILQMIAPDRRVLAEWVVDDVTEIQDFKNGRFK
ncbi:hypothetical protein AB1L05_21900 [Cytobacillus horneckiae]|uniref:hypothetical protein n=1 Tax=Cytobacillus horneckiae TaxID=549687 RepID=UPI0039A3D52E